MLGACAAEGDPELDSDCETCDGKAPLVGQVESLPIATCKLTNIVVNKIVEVTYPGIQCDRAYMEDGTRPAGEVWFGARATPNEFAAAETELGKGVALSGAWEQDSDVQLFFEYTVKTILPAKGPRAIVSAKKMITATVEELRAGVTIYSKYSYIPVSFASSDVINAQVDFGYERNSYKADWSSTETTLEPYSETLKLTLAEGRVDTMILYDGVNDPVIAGVTFTNAIDEVVGSSEKPFTISGPMNLTAERDAGLRLEVDSDRKF